MRILAVTNIWPSAADPGGGAFIAQQVEGLRRAGLDVRVFDLDRPRLGRRAYRHLGARCRAALVDERADLVHVMYGGIMADRVTAAIAAVPTVVSFCGSDLLGEPLARLDRRVMAWAGVVASRRAAAAAAGIVVKSRNLQEALPRAIDRRRVRVISNGVDLDRFRPIDRRDCQSALGWNADRLHVLFPKTNGAAVKRPELALAAIERARADGLSVELHQLAGVPHAVVPTWMNASDLLLMTSAHEGSPNVVKEALACDVPIVSVDVGDVAERIGGVAGCHLAEPDAGALAEKIRAVAEGRRRVEGRRHVAALSIARVSSELASFYAELLQQRRASTRNLTHAAR